MKRMLNMDGFMLSVLFLYNNETHKNAPTLWKKFQAVENIELKF